MAGGYGREVDTTVAIHRRTLELALQAWQRWPRAAHDALHPPVQEDSATA
jgi:hypothetical protein